MRNKIFFMMLCCLLFFCGFNPVFASTQVTTLPEFFPTDSAGDTTYYGHWKALPSNITFDMGGGTGVSDLSGETGQTNGVTTMPTPVRVGYDFGGWYDNPGFTGIPITIMPSTYPAGGIRYYAKWTVASYKVIFESNGGSSVVFQTRGGSDLRLIRPQSPYRDGYTFIGWYKDPTYINAWNFDTDIVTANTTLYGRWRVGLPSSSDPIQNWSWSQIRTVASSGGAAGYFSVGDEKQVLIGDDIVTMQVYGFNHDTLGDGTNNKSNITFGTKGILSTERIMNQTYSSTNGWSGSSLRSQTNGTIYDNLPSEIKSVIVPVKKLSSSGGVTPVLEASIDNVFLFSEIELSGQNTISMAGEGLRYPVFSIDATTRVKKSDNGNGVAGSYWTRSVCNGAASNYVTMTASGNAGNTASFGTSGVVFGFAIGNAPTNTYSVAFNTDGGSVISDMTATYNTTISAPVVPTKSGLYFVGWYKDSGLTQPWNFTTDKVMGNTTLYAKWSSTAPLPEIPGSPPASGTVISYSWSEIKAISDSGNADKYMTVGQTKTATMTNGEVITMEIYGFNHDDKVSGGKAGITFGTKDLINTPRAVNPTKTNVGGWNSSNLRGFLNGINTTNASSNYATGTSSVYSKLPADLKDLIVPVYKKTSGGSSNNTLVTSTDKLFAFSEVELYGSNPYSIAGEGLRYPIFTAGTTAAANATRIKKLGGYAEHYWTRSPYCNVINGFGLTYSDGTANYYYSDGVNGVAFGFCI